MASEQEAQEARDFIEAHKGEWLGMDCDPCDEECPTIALRTEEGFPIAYDFNEVCSEAGIAGGIEEHGYGDWFVTDED